LKIQKENRRKEILKYIIFKMIIIIKIKVVVVVEEKIKIQILKIEKFEVLTLY
jgi:hypothetical protein